MFEVRTSEMKIENIRCESSLQNIKNNLLLRIHQCKVPMSIIYILGGGKHKS